MARPKTKNITDNEGITSVSEEVPPETTAEVPSKPNYKTPGGAPMLGYPGIIREDK